MCGFWGYVGMDREENDLFSDRARIELKKRGRDGFGETMTKSSILMHARLNLNGANDTGLQPFKIGEKYALYNGEIYNKTEISKQYNLSILSSDTEILIHLLANNKLADVTQIINGMYAIAVYSERSQELELAVDQYGQKPLFYRLTSNSIMFGSQASTVKMAKNTLRTEQLVNYLNFGFVSPQSSIFQGVERVQPGETIVLDTAERRAISKSLKTPRFSDWREGGQLTDIISEYADSPFPTGVTLSGGIDSSIVAERYAKSYQGRKIGFTVQVGDARFSEAPQAKKFAERLGIEHRIIEINQSEVPGYWKEGVSVLDEPNSDSAIITTTALMRGAMTDVKCLLSGDGGDEVFGGYNRHKLGYLFNRIKDKKVLIEFIKLGASFPRGIKMLSKTLFPSGTGGEFDLRIKSLVRALKADDVWALYVRSLAIDDLFVTLLEENPPIKITDGSHDSDMLSLDRYFYLVGNNLTRMDKISLAHGIECRAPLLDDRIKPSNLKDIKLKSKPLLRKLHTDIYGSNKIIKKGFSYPITHHLLGKDFFRYFQIGVDIVNESLNGSYEFNIDKISERRAYNLGCLGLWYS